MDRLEFVDLLRDELGENLAKHLIWIEFDRPISFMIGETSEEILSKIQQATSLRHCRKINCYEHCFVCSLNPAVYAKLFWFVQRLLIMSPLTKPFIKPKSLNKEDFNDIVKDKTLKETSMRTICVSSKINKFSLMINLFLLFVVLFLILF